MALSVYLKKFFGEIKLLAKSSANDEVFLLAEDDGTLKEALYGKNSSAVLKALRVNSNDQLQVEIVENPQQIDPVELTTSDAAIYNPGSTASEVYDVWILFDNRTTTARTIDVGIDLGGGTIHDRVRKDDFVIPALEDTGFLYIGQIAGDDDVVAKASANSAVTAFFMVKRRA